MFRPAGAQKGLINRHASVGGAVGLALVVEVEVVVGLVVQTGVTIGVSMTTVTGPVHGVKVVEVVQDPRYGMVIVVVEGYDGGSRSSRPSALTPNSRQNSTTRRRPRIFTVQSI